MEKYVTGDGSETFFNEEYKEHYHSRTGAVEEAFEKYVKPCRIRELAMTGRIKILDICFGLGYNSIAAIDAALSANSKCEIEITGLEKDDKVIRELHKLKPDFKNYKILANLEFDPKNNFFLYEDSHIFLKIKIGDARETIKTVSGQFDAVFLDPFSPPKNPELWTAEFLSVVAKHMKKDAILATYSCARKVRDNLKAAGFEVWDGPCVGRRSPSTLARIK